MGTYTPLQILTNEIRKKMQETFTNEMLTRSQVLWDLCALELLGYEKSTYLDIGAGRGYNTQAFAMHFNEALGIDIKLHPHSILKGSKIINLAVGDGLNLPLKNSTFDVISLFSIVEHVTSCEVLLQETFRVLKPGGIAIIQFPNNLFPFEIHSVLPLINYIPRSIKNTIFKKTSYAWLLKINIPSLKQLNSIINRIEPNAQVTLIKVKFPSKMITPSLRPFYHLSSKIGLLDLIPLDYILIVHKNQ
jgi:ubiquinone/menaquinone biosynthesis C-methylase UbiE